MVKKIICIISCLFIIISSSFVFACKDKFKLIVEEHDNYISYQNIEYGEGERQLVDICLPKNKSGEIGLILMIHGGGWSAGDKDGYFPSLVSWCNDKGYVTASINYRYASENIHANDILDDITNSLNKIKEIASNHNLNVTKMLLTGGSAGGHLSLLYAYSKANISPIKPVAVVSFCGPTDLADENFFLIRDHGDDLVKMISKISGYDVVDGKTDKSLPFLKQASPITYVNENTVPTVIAHGQVDNVVPYSNALTLKSILDSYGVKNDLVTYSNSGHGLENDAESTARTDRLMVEYAQLYL